MFVYHIISLSSLCKLIWRHWTYKMPVRYFLSSVWVRLSIFSQLSIIQDMGLCVFSLPISLVMIERIYTLSYYHHQIGSMNYFITHSLGLGHETMVCAICLSICLLTWLLQWMPPWWQVPLQKYRVNLNWHAYVLWCVLVLCLLRPFLSAAFELFFFYYYSGPVVYKLP